MKVGEFFVELLVDGAAGQVSVRDLASGFGALEAATLGEIGALVALGVKLAQIADQAMQTAVAFEMFETQTGLSSQRMQVWQIAAEQANVSAQAVTSSITALEKNLAAIRMGQGNVSPFQILGIGANQDAFAVLDQLRDRLKNVNAATATNIIAQMGLDPSMLQVLRLSNEEFGQFASTARGLSGDQANGALKLRLALTQFELKLRDVGYAAVTNFRPIVQLLEDVTFLIDRLMKGVSYLAEHFSYLGTVFKTLLLVNPFSAMLLMLDDVITYFRGGNSLLGLAVQGFTKLFETLEAKAKELAPHMEAIAGGALKLASVGAMLGPLAVSGLASDVAGQAARSVVQSNTLHQTIHSSAPADEVARASVGEHARQVNNAALLIDNGER